MNLYVYWICAYRELYPAVMMMKAAEDRPSGHLAEPLDRPVGRRILVQGQMCSEFVVIVDIGRKDAAQTGLAQHDDLIQAFPSDRSDQSLGMPILPGLPRSYWVITDAHGGKPPWDGMAIGRPAVSDEMVRRFMPRDGFGDLPGRPLRRGLC